MSAFVISNLRFILYISILFVLSCQDPKHGNGSLTEESPIDLGQTEQIEIPEVDGNRGTWQKPDKVLEMLGDLKEKTIADIGAGIGYFSIKLLVKAEKVIAIDIDPEMIQILNGIKGLNNKFEDRLDVRLATPTDPQLKPKEVDIILIVNTISYIQPRVEYLKNLKDKLKEGGSIVIVDFKTKKFPDYIKEAPEYADRVYLHVVEEQLEEAGYKISNSDDTSLEFQYMVVASPEE